MIEGIEPASDITRRFCAGPVSLGALSREAHKSLSIAMNPAGDKSNSGEGGGDDVCSLDLTDVNKKGCHPAFPHIVGLKNDDSTNS